MEYTSDLNITDRRENMWCFYYFNNVTTLNKPISSSGIMILYTNIDSSEYGGEYAFCNGDIYGRKLYGGKYGAWGKIF